MPFIAGDCDDEGTAFALPALNITFVKCVVGFAGKLNKTLQEYHRITGLPTGICYAKRNAVSGPTAANVIPPEYNARIAVRHWRQ